MPRSIALDARLHEAGRVTLRGPLGFAVVAAFHAGLILVVAAGLRMRQAWLPPPTLEMRMLDERAPVDPPPRPLEPSLVSPQRIEIVTPEVPLPIDEAAPREDATTLSMRVEPDAGSADPQPLLPALQSPRVDPRTPLSQPPYPPVARRLEQQGTVELRLLVGPDGRVQQAEIESSSGSAYLDEAARNEALRRWRFLPARRGEEPVSAWHAVRVRFRLDER